MAIRNILGLNRLSRYFTTRRLLHLCQIHMASSTVTHILILNPFILALSPTVLLLMLISSLPFCVIYFPAVLLWLYDETRRYHRRLGMAFTCLGVGTSAIWFWSWGVARGIMSTCSSVVGAWYFAECVLFLSFRLFLSHRYSFLALLPQYHHQCQYTPFKAVSNGSAEAPVVLTLPPIVGINFGNSIASIAVFIKVKGAIAMCFG